MDRDQKHRCKFCGRSFPSGRSLGGHMRRHVSSPASSAAADGVESRGPGYGLRENRKKTWRLSDLKAPAPAMEGSAAENKRCRECGKGFQSWRALFGHMRCHSEKLSKTGQKQKQGEDEDEDGQQQEDEGSWSVAGSHKKGSRSRRPVPGPGPASSSSASEGCYSKEQEDVAISLMMLSRDAAYCGVGFGHFEESSDKNSAVLGKNNSELDNAFEENSDESLTKKKKKIGSNSKLGFDSESTRSRYECAHCNKGFDTYQALGGHRASHKRSRGCFAPKGSEPGASIDRSVVGNGSGSHQCPICGKVFGSGQALGGHKRSHLVMATPTAAVFRQRAEGGGLIDLNIPAAAPVAEESSKGSVTIAAAGGDEYGSWWARSSIHHEGMISMIAN